MTELPLAQAVETFARPIVGVADAELERFWAYKAHDDEGVRFACFVTYQELCELAVAIESERAAHGPAVTRVQRILAQHQAAYRDVLGALAGVGTDEIGREPAPGEWPLRTVLNHIIGTELAFFDLARYAVGRVRAGDDRPKAMPKPSEDPMQDFIPTLDTGTLAEILAAYDEIHAAGLADLSGLTDDELRAPSLWWEGYDVEAAHRLYRCDAHLRQHTIQLDKTLAGIGHPPSEAERLVRMIYGALGRCEGALIGAPSVAAGEQAASTETITARTGEVAAALA